MEFENYSSDKSILVSVFCLSTSLLLLLFQNHLFVIKIKTALHQLSAPMAQRLSGVMISQEFDESSTISNEHLRKGGDSHFSTIYIRSMNEQLKNENANFLQLLHIKEDLWSGSIASRVISRPPQRWFQEIIIDKGIQDGIFLDSPVIGIGQEKAAVVGHVIEVTPQTSKVMLLQDSLSSIPARLEGHPSDDGVVEGTNANELLFKFLSRDSKVKIGDLVVTSGLGGSFPSWNCFGMGD